MIQSVDGKTPEIDETAFVHETATVIGEVKIGPEASVWPGAVLRGDRGRILLQERSNVQDNATLHESAVLRPGATVGHNAVVHGATVDPDSIVGMGAVVLDDTTVGTGSIVAANSTVIKDQQIPENVLVAGTPATVIDELDERSSAGAGDAYVALARTYAATAGSVDCGNGTEES